MIRGLYTSGWSMMAASKKMDVITNNMANANSTSYKKDYVVYQSFPEVLAKRINDLSTPENSANTIGTMRLGNDIVSLYTNFKEGALKKTDSKFDLAISNSENAFFTVAVPQQNGNTRNFYTRDGSFTLNSRNELVTGEGYNVIGENGVIVLNGEDFNIGEDGSVYENGELVDRLRITEFQDANNLRKVGNSMYEADQNAQTRQFSGKVAQGYLEDSNVEILKEMTEMITTVKIYETNQKILQYQDSTLEKAVNEVGMLR